MSELSPEQIAQLLSLPERKRGSSGTYRKTPGTTKSVRIDYDDRSWSMWWKLPTTGADCEVPKHDESESPRNHMCATINDIKVCRRCYVKSLDKA